MSSNKTPTKYEVGQAADLLGLDIFYLSRALLAESEVQFKLALRNLRDYETPNFGVARQLLRGAQVADEAWREEVGITDEVEPVEAIA